MSKPKTQSAVVSSELVLRRRQASIARIVISCMGWMNGWSATPEAERESADKAAKRIMRMVAKWKSQNVGAETTPDKNL